MRNQFFFLLAFVFTIGNSVKAQDYSHRKPDSRGYLVQIGDQAPDFEVVYADGAKTKLSAFRGKVVMLQFTASWCGVCRKEMPYIEKEVWLPNKDKGLVLLGVDRGEKPQKVKAFAKQSGISYPLILDQNSDIFFKYAHQNAGVTRNVIIDQSGKIVFLTRLFEREEFDEMKKVIKDLLAY